MAKFAVGDVVQLKSGGPKMTVQEVLMTVRSQAEQIYRCQWFAGSKLQNGNFPESSLVVPEEKPQ